MSLSGTGSKGKYNEHTHDISLCSDSYQTIDVFTYWHQNLSCHMSTLLGSWCLIFNVYTSSSLFNEQLSELHDRCQSTMSGIRICNNRTEVVNVLKLGAIRFRLGHYSLFALFAVMEELCHEKMSDLIWDRGLDELALLTGTKRVGEYKHKDNLRDLVQVRPRQKQ
jgi:hypothetical protein